MVIEKKLKLKFVVIFLALFFVLFSLILPQTIKANNIEGNTNISEEQTDFTGLQKQSDGSWLYFSSGVFQNSYNGLVKHVDGKYYYVKNGKVDFGKTGIIKNTNGNWYYVKKGVWKPTANGLSKHTNGKYYYVKNGKVNFGKTGIIKNSNGNWYYVKKGVWKPGATGLSKHTNGKYYYVYKGKVQFYKSGLVKHSNGKCYYIEAGVKKSNYNGIAKYGNKYYKVKNGKKVGAGKTAGKLSKSELNSAAKTVARGIAACARRHSSNKWEQVAYATEKVYNYCLSSKYTSKGSAYREAYGPFVKKQYTCAGSTRALGLVLDYLGVSWTHANPNKWTHQWCNIKISGKKGWADGMMGATGKGKYPF